MLKTLILFVPVLLQAAAQPGSVSEPSYWRYAHSDAKVLAGVEWKRMAQTPAGVAIRGLAGSSEIPGFSATELLDQIDRLLISSPGGANAKLKKQAPVLIIATGRFDLSKFRKLAIKEKATIKPYKTAEFIYPPGYKVADTLVALVDAQTILIGERPVVMAAIDKARAISGPLSAFNKLFARATAASTDHDLWMISSVSPSELYSANGPATPQMPFLNDITGADLGMDFHDGLGLSFRMATKSDESAQGMAGMMKMMMNMAATQASTGNDQGNQQMQDFLKTLDIRAEASDVKISMKIDQAQLQQGIQQAIATAMKPKKAPVDLGGFKPAAGLASSNTIRQVVPVDIAAMTRPAEPQKAAEPPAPPKKQFIRIEGLDEGTREIPYPQTNKD